MSEPILTLRVTPGLIEELDNFASKHSMSRAAAGMMLLAFGLRNERDLFHDAAKLFGASLERSHR